jgi:hypothetical protein
MLHVYMRNEFVASIVRQHPFADNHDPQQPWLLLISDGRIRRFGTMTEAKDEAQKRWAPVRFKRN